MRSSTPTSRLASSTTSSCSTAPVRCSRRRTRCTPTQEASGTSSRSTGARWPGRLRSSPRCSCTRSSTSPGKATNSGCIFICRLNGSGSRTMPSGRSWRSFSAGCPTCCTRPTRGTLSPPSRCSPTTGRRTWAGRGCQNGMLTGKRCPGTCTARLLPTRRSRTGAGSSAASTTLACSRSCSRTPGHSVAQPWRPSSGRWAPAPLNSRSSSGPWTWQTSS
mmetsp:Transcript_22507/g.70616  ORF Transcript_22507/g.70616 Transcript_22507/m.70616 type:complete len:219 (-) Transcript_22507:181-837(-)